MIDPKDKVHLIGVGGISMQGIARTLIDNGNYVSGSDIKESDYVEKLNKLGANISIGHDAKNVDKDLDWVVISNAIPDDNPEIKRAKENNIPVLTNTEMIQKIIDSKKIIGVAGTHGKSTVSAMISFILEKNDFKPTFYLGAFSNQLQGSAKYRAKGKVAVVEACEYKDAFLNYRPDLIVITNIEEEHMDYYSSLDQIKKSYLSFISNLRDDGKLIVCGESDTALAVAKESNKEYLTYGFNSNFDYQVDPNLDLKVFGRHNNLNGLAAAVGATNAADLSIEQAQYTLEKFQGIKRRSEYLGRKKSVLIYDDYAHHPTEVKATLKAFKDQFKNKNIFLVFQPHQLDRLNSFYDDFVSSLVIADKIIVLKTFQPPGRDSKQEKKSVDLYLDLNQAGVEAYYARDYDQAAEISKDKAVTGDIILTMGAGPVFEVAEKYLKK